MSEIAISLKNVSKCFKRYARPVDRLKELLLPGKSRADEFWALRDINLEVPKGQALGIVGRNGSGKSTLLQIIVKTITPTTGEIRVNGRISALLELGSGFNPEFTGRQNVFFNGRLLGLERKDIEAKFDEIAGFADISDFMEQPVKTYSSGMFVRLAFAVAISVEPDIFIVDEALAVGDEAFQRKCFGRIQALQERGVTILFVSHSAPSVIGLCSSAVLIDKGENLLVSTPKKVISNYQKLIYAPVDEAEKIREKIRNGRHFIKNDIVLEASQEELEYLNSSQTKAVDDFHETYDPNFIPKSTLSYVSCGALIEKPYVTTIEGRRVNVIKRRKEYIYTYSVKFLKKIHGVRFGMVIKTIEGFELGGAASHSIDNPIEYIDQGKELQVKFRFYCSLQPGVYFLNAGILGRLNHSEVFIHRLVDAAMFRVQPEESDTSRSGYVDFCVESQILSFNCVMEE
ncbi:ABC transporter ATP-binding protein [Coleofasciculus sp. H7-2]|uniref:ABC transporter ATP-binding protein n=1 Tax=Coleofasciculus sp. H7-2 TaxID=3351545 RepID=UPI00366E14A7